MGVLGIGVWVRVGHRGSARARALEKGAVVAAVVVVVCFLFGIVLRVLLLTVAVRLLGEVPVLALVQGVEKGVVQWMLESGLSGV